MKKTFYLIGLNLSLAVLLIIVPSLLIRSRQGATNISGNQQFSLTKSHPLTFFFNSNFGNLQSISLDMKNPNVANNSKIFVNISSPNDSRQITFSGSNVGDPATVPLKFLPFNDTASTPYNVTITTDNLKTESLFVTTNQNNQPVFRTFYQQTNFKSNLQFNIQRQLQLIRQRDLITNILYFGLIIFLDLYIITHD